MTLVASVREPFPNQPSNAMTCIRRDHPSAESNSSRLLHREITDGLLRPPFDATFSPFKGGRSNPSASSSRFSAGRCFLILDTYHLHHDPSCHRVAFNPFLQPEGQNTRGTWFVMTSLQRVANISAMHSKTSRVLSRVGTDDWAAHATLIRVSSEAH